MAMVLVSSDNPDFSYMIEKNPDSGMSVRSVRMGKAFGWYPNGDEQQYAIYFKDGENQISFKKSEQDVFEYLNVEKYSSPVAVMNLLTSFFHNVLKGKESAKKWDKKGIRNEVTVPIVSLKSSRQLQKLPDYFENVNIDIESVYEEGNLYKVTFSGEDTFEKLLNQVWLYAVFASVFSQTFLDMDEGLIKKTSRAMNLLDVPYYLRYVFIQKGLYSKKVFMTVKDELEESERYDLDLQYGDTGKQRRDFVMKKMAFDKDIVDIGSGKGFYAFPFAKRLKDHRVHAIDIDMEVVEALRGKRRVKEVNNLDVYGSTEEFLEGYDQEQVDVLMVEVIEHMPEEEAKVLIQQVLKELDVGRLVITTPNQEFNRYYMMDEEMRHDDHDWEKTGPEFESFMEDVLEGVDVEEDLEYEFYQVGDLVNGVSPSQAVVIDKVESPLKVEK